MRLDGGEVNFAPNWTESLAAALSEFDASDRGVLDDDALRKLGGVLEDAIGTIFGKETPEWFKTLSPDARPEHMNSEGELTCAGCLKFYELKGPCFRVHVLRCRQ